MCQSASPADCSPADYSQRTCYNSAVSLFLAYAANTCINSKHAMSAVQTPLVTRARKQKHWQQPCLKATSLINTYYEWLTLGYRPVLEDMTYWLLLHSLSCFMCSTIMVLGARQEVWCPSSLICQQ